MHTENYLYKITNLNNITICEAICNIQCKKGTHFRAPKIMLIFKILTKHTLC